MNKNFKIILAAIFAVGFSANAHEVTKGLVDNSGQVVRDNSGDCVEVTGNKENTECGYQEIVVPPTVIEEVVTLSAQTLFDTDKSAIKPAGREALDEFASSVKKAKQIGDIKRVTAIKVVGHTDSVGRAEYNQGLSERRAASVRNYLIQQGVNASLITASGEGESNPVGDNKTAAGRQQNRRVVITVSGTREVEVQ